MNKLLTLATLAALMGSASAQVSETDAVCRTLQPYFGAQISTITKPWRDVGQDLSPELIKLKAMVEEDRVAEQKMDRTNFANLPHLDRFLKVRQALMKRWREFPNTEQPNGLGRDAYAVHRDTERVAVELAQNLGYSICMAL